MANNLPPPASRLQPTAYSLQPSYAAGLRLSEALDRAENLLERVSANQFQVPGHDARSTPQRSGHSESGFSGGRQGSDQQACDATYAQALLCDRTFGSWSGLNGHQQIVWPQQFHNNHGLTALPQAASFLDTQPLGLAASKTMPALGGSQLADRFAKIEAQFAKRADAAATGTATGTATPAARTAAHSVQFVRRSHLPTVFWRQKISLAR